VAPGQVAWPALPGVLWEMSNNSDQGERKGHKRKLADALTPPAVCTTEPSTTGEGEPILSQVRAALSCWRFQISISGAGPDVIGGCAPEGVPPGGGHKDVHVAATGQCGPAVPATSSARPG
jgi:hypothetical protein